MPQVQVKGGIVIALGDVNVPLAIARALARVEQYALARILWHVDARRETALHGRDAHHGATLRQVDVLCAVAGPPDSPDGLAAGGVLSSPTAPDPRAGAIDLGAAGGVDAAREAVQLARLAPHQASTLREVFAPLQALTPTQNSQQHALRGDAEMPPNLQESHQDMSSGSGPIPTSIYTVSLQQAGLGVLCRVWAAFCSEHGEAPSREEALALTRTLIGSTWLRGKRALALTRAAGKPLLDPSARVLIRMRYGRTLYCRAKPSMAL